jgi:hypothetical protein
MKMIGSANSEDEVVTKLIGFVEQQYGKRVKHIATGDVDGDIDESLKVVVDFEDGSKLLGEFIAQPFEGQMAIRLRGNFVK